MMEIGESIHGVVHLAMANVGLTVSWALWEYEEHPGRWNASRIDHEPVDLPMEVVRAYWQVQASALTYRVVITIPPEAPLQLRFLFRDFPTISIDRVSGRVVWCVDRLRLPAIAELLDLRSELLFSSREYFLPLPAETSS